MLKRILFVLLVTAIVACGSKPRVDLANNPMKIVPTAQHSVIAKDVVGLFENYSYKKVPLGDSISSIIYANLLNSIDEGKNYLMQSDIDQFESYRYLLAKDFKKGDLSAAYQVFNTYISRYLERMEFALQAIEQDHDFEAEEDYVYFRKDLNWFASQEEADEQWRKRVKYDLLNLRLSSTDRSDSASAKQVETLKNRYNQLISQAKKTDNNEAFQVIMAALTDAIDPHTSYFNPYFAQQFNEGISNTFEGIGARLTMENEVVKVAEVIAGGPVFKEKALEIDDRIIGVAQGEEGEFEDIIGWRLDNAVAKIKGPKGTIVRLKVIPAGQDLTATPRIVSLTRDKIILEEESAKKEIKTIKGDDGKTYKVGVISIPKFYLAFEDYRRGDPNYKSTTRDVRMIIDTLKQEQVDGIIIDLRFNGGGSLIESIELTGLFIDKGPVVQVRDTRNRVEVNHDEEAGVVWDGPLAVMINRFSASASEIFAGAIQDYGRGLILGTQSYGKGTVQSAIDMERVISPTDRLLLKAKSDESGKDVLPSGAPQFGQINITMAKFYRITGSSTQHKGVMPDIVFPSIYDGDKYGESSQASALPWDQINPTRFDVVEDLSKTIQQLEKNHVRRMVNSLEYKFLLEDIEAAKVREKEVSVALNEAILKKQRDENQQKNRDRINQALKIRGLPAWNEGEPQPKIDFDFIKDESLKVMADFISIKKS
jgi:carboxyl-terminal processing protease